ncbi:MAG: hypothetical protein K0Q64_2171 [Nitrobacter vulgaris]|nr:hypothetical protein [Nitrobacter vulgaris]
MLQQPAARMERARVARCASAIGMSDARPRRAGTTLRISRADDMRTVDRGNHVGAVVPFELPAQQTAVLHNSPTAVLG